MNMTFSSSDTYKVSHKKKDEKFNIDYKVLLRLYGPIVGANAIGLYLMLESEVSLNKGKRLQLKIARLLKLLQMDNARVFTKAVDQLVDAKLLSYKANAKKENDYKFILNPTLSADEFFNDENLSGDLQVIVDETYLGQVKEYFISKRDEDDEEDDEYVEIDEMLNNKISNEKDFFDKFLGKFAQISSINVSNTDKVKMKHLIEMYHPNYIELEDYVLKSIVTSPCDDISIIDFDKLIEFFVEKCKEDATSNKKKTYADLFVNETPHSVYMKNTGRHSLLPTETNMIDELIDMVTSQGMDEKVLNVIFDYYFKYSNNPQMRPSKNYFIKVIEEMVMNDVKTIEDAMNYFKNRNERIKKYKEKKENIKNTNNIDVKNDTIKESITDNTNSKELDDEEEIRKFKELLGG